MVMKAPPTLLLAASLIASIPVPGAFTQENGATYPAYLRGAIVPMVTPYRGEHAEEVDWEALVRFTDYLSRTRAAALFPVSGMGQWRALSIQERKQVIATCVTAARGRKPILAGTGTGHGIDDALEVARFAESAGADGLVAITPDFVRNVSTTTAADPGIQDRLADYYMQLCRSVRLPILLYDPGTVVEPRTLSRLLDSCPNIAGIKYRETDDMSRMRAMVEAARGRAAILSGSEIVAVKAMRVGAQGFIGGGLNVYPDLGQDLVEAAQKGDWALAERIQIQVAELNEKVERLSGGALGAKKILNDVLGVRMDVTNRGDVFRGESQPGEFEAILDSFRKLDLPRYRAPQP